MRKTNEKGITLIALVITIIVMIILVVVTVAFAIGDDGIIGNSKNAKEQTAVKADRESLQDYILGEYVYNAITGDINLTELNTNLTTAGWEEGNVLNNVLTIKGKQSRKTFTITNKGRITEVGENSEENEETTEENSVWTQNGNTIQNQDGSKILTVGDYINYNVSYTNLITNDSINSGWRIFGVRDGKLEIISESIPIAAGFGAEEGREDWTDIDTTEEFLTTHFQTTINWGTDYPIARRQIGFRFV